MKKHKNTILIILILITQSLSAQTFSAKADLRARYENRHGFSTLFNDSLEGGNFVVQRTRLIFNYSTEKIKLRVSPQNVRIWGDVSTTSDNDSANALHEAWAELDILSKLSLRIGRQELNYDDARILGNVDWLMQARSHDLALLQIKPDTNNTLHLGFAMNATKEINTKEFYQVAGQYKYAQFLWYHRQFINAGLSILSLNQGVPYLDTTSMEIAWNQNSGARFNFNKMGISLEIAGYYQTGKIAQNTLSAYYGMAGLSFKTKSGITVGAGCEHFSGKAGNDQSKTIKSFTPWYGTNHKFNGYMDYFFVNNHKFSVGLTDIYLNLIYEKNKFKATITPHMFASAAKLYVGNEAQNSNLGNELDLTLQYQIVRNIVLTAGYSQMFATKSMQILKGGDYKALNNWTYIALHFSPEIFNYKN